MDASRGEYVLPHFGMTEVEDCYNLQEITQYGNSFHWPDFAPKQSMANDPEIK